MCSAFCQGDREPDGSSAEERSQFDMKVAEFATGTKVGQRLPRWLSSKESTCNAGAKGDAGSIPGWEDPLEEGMATHSSIRAWRILWTEEPGRLQSIEVQRDATEHACTEAGDFRLQPPFQWPEHKPHPWIQILVGSLSTGPQ